MIKHIFKTAHPLFCCVNHTKISAGRWRYVNGLNFAEGLYCELQHFGQPCHLKSIWRKFSWHGPSPSFLFSDMIWPVGYDNWVMSGKHMPISLPSYCTRKHGELQLDCTCLQDLLDAVQASAEAYTSLTCLPSVPS